MDDKDARSCKKRLKTPSNFFSSPLICHLPVCRFCDFGASDQMMRCLQIHSGLWGLVCNPDSAADILDAKETGGKKREERSGGVI